MLHVFIYVLYYFWIGFYQLLSSSGLRYLRSFKKKHGPWKWQTNYSQLVCGWMMAGSGSTRLRFGGPNDPYDSHRGNDPSTFDLNKNRVKRVIPTVLILIEMNALIFVDPSRSGGGVDIEGMRFLSAGLVGWCFDHATAATVMPSVDHHPDCGLRNALKHHLRWYIWVNYNNSLTWNKTIFG